MRDGVAFVSRETADGRIARVAIVDAPFWLFALPAALRLEHPERKFDTWFVNCNPRVLPGVPSTLAFTPRGDLDVRSREGGFFHSPIQRFLWFGATPDHAPPVAEGAPMGIVPLEPGADPAALRISFRDVPARDSTCVVQFRGWTPVRITWPGASPSALGRGAAPGFSPAAPSPPAPARR
jgi:hypothetical protein